MSALVDTSVFCGHWPFRRLPLREHGALKAHLAGHGVSQAWVASAEALLYPDPMHGNEPLLAAVRGDPFFVPVAVLDLVLAGWRRDARECVERLGCRAVKLAPNYHGYALSEPRADELAEWAGAAGVPVCIQLRMMDERTHHPLMKVPGVPAEEVAALARRHPKTRFLACAAHHGALKTFSSVENLWAELSFVESKNTLTTAIAALGAKRLVFGSHSPLMYFEAMAAKLDAAPEDVPPEHVRAVREENAAALLGNR